MKKIVTLFISAITLAAGAQAQTTEEARRVILGQKKENNKRNDDGDILGRRDDRRNDEDRRYSGSREAEIDRVNREYDYKIQSIRNNNTLSSEEKDRIIRGLNRDRDREIKRINNSYKDRRDRDDDDDYRKDKKDKKYKSNRGKHKGWEKGKGNKHRDRDDD